MIGDDGHGVVELRHLMHAGHLQRLRVVERGERAAEHRGSGDGRDLHARHLDVDAEHRRAVDLAGNIEPLGRRADDAELAGVLERDVGRDGQLGCIVDQRAVGDALLARAWTTYPARWSAPPHRRRASSPPPRPALPAPRRRLGAAANRRHGWKTNCLSSARRRGRRCRRACRSAANAPRPHCPCRHRALRRPASAATCRCLAPSRSSARRPSLCPVDRCG